MRVEIRFFSEILFVLVAAGSTGSSITCYQCSSLDDLSCATSEPDVSFLRPCGGPNKNPNITSPEEAFDQIFDSKGETDLFVQGIMPQDQEQDDMDKDYTICRKIEVQVKETGAVQPGTSEWRVQVIRQCGYVSNSKYDHSCVWQKNHNNIQQTVCSCTENACNMAGRLKLWPWSLPTLALALVVGIYASCGSMNE